MDLDAGNQTGPGDESTTEVAVRAAASIADKALGENRAVGITVNAHRLTVLPADRGGRQRLKILQLLAAVEADGRTPLAEALVTGVSRLRRGMTAIVVTSSQDAAFVRPARDAPRPAASRRSSCCSTRRRIEGPARDRTPRGGATVRAEDARPRSSAPARPRAAPRARRIRAPDLRRRPRPGPGRGPRAMRSPASARAARRGLAAARAGSAIMPSSWRGSWTTRAGSRQGELTDVLPVCARSALSPPGSSGPKVGWARWTAHLVGAFFAALFLPIFAGWSEPPGASPARPSCSTAERRSRRTSTSRWHAPRGHLAEVHYSSSSAGSSWAPASSCLLGVRPSAAARRGRRAGLVLVVNMALTTGNDQVAGSWSSSAPLAVPAREMHALDERTTWIRRRIGDPSTIARSTSAAGPCSSSSPSWARCCSWTVRRPLRSRRVDGRRPLAHRCQRRSPGVPAPGR